LRIVSVTHVKELIEQNYLELLQEWPFAPAGIYSAGLGRRDTQAQILFCGIQSVHNKAAKIGHVDLLMVDECHLIPKSDSTRYARFIQDLLAINPEMRICGFTATPYRTDSGRLDEGDERLFTEVVYEYGIADGIRDGYLTALVSKATATGFDMSGVARRGGDYVDGALQKAVDKEETTRAAVAEIVTAGAARKSWLVFCAGVEHANHVCDEIRTHGISCEVITGDTPSHERRRHLADFKSGKLRALTNNSVLTTGFNAPGVDLLAGLRPTLSAGLYVQIGGRGTRPVYAKGMPLDTVEQRLAAIAAGPKPNCLYMDFAGNVMRHGPLDMVVPRKPGEGTGEAPVKECPNCRSLVHISKKECPDCGFEFPENEKPKHSATSAAVPILSTEAPKWLKVQSRKFYYHENAEGAESVRVDFLANFVSYKMWLSIKKAKGRADKFWRDHVGREPYPADVEEWLDRHGELRQTAEIQVRPKGRYFEIVGIKSAEQHEKPGPIVPDKSYRQPPQRVTGLIDDDIPF
jgi:DNA repair protein RadD